MIIRDAGNFCPSPSFIGIRNVSLTFLLFCLLAFIVPAADIQTINPQLESQLFKQAEKAFRKGNLDEAEKIYFQILEANRSHTKAKLRLSHVYLKKRYLVEGYDLAADVIRTDPKNSYAYALAGNCLLGLGNFRAARATLIAAFRLDNDNALAGAGLGMLDFYENRLDDSMQKLGWAKYKDPDEPDFLIAYAQVSARMDKYKEAAAAYREFLRVAPPADADRRDRIRGLIDFLEYLGNRSLLYDIDGQTKTTIPIELVNDRPIIRLRIGKNKEELRFVIDTGSNITVVSQKTADRLNLKEVARGGNAKGVGGDGKFEIVYGFLPSITVGEVKIRNVPVYLRSFPTEVGSYDGYIGLAMISKFLTTIDPGTKTMTLTKRSNIDEPMVEAPLAENEVVSNLRLTPSGFLSGEVKLPGIEVPLNFIVDTGAELSVISTELAGRDEVKEFVRKEKIRVVGAAGVTEGVSLFHLPSVSVGKHRVDDVRALALNLSVINENAGFEQAGILGGNFLKHYRLKFDFRNYTLSFIPIKDTIDDIKE